MFCPELSWVPLDKKATQKLQKEVKHENTNFYWNGLEKENK